MNVRYTAWNTIPAPMMRMYTTASSNISTGTLIIRYIGLHRKMSTALTARPNIRLASSDTVYVSRRRSVLLAPRYCDISIVAAVHMTENTMSSRFTIWFAFPMAPTRS